MEQKEKDELIPQKPTANIKAEILGMVRGGQNPFDIIYEAAKYLEEESKEPGYARIVLDNMRAVYGLALKDRIMLADELKDVIERGKRIQAAYDNGDFSPEEKERINMALTYHKKKAEQIEDYIKYCEAHKLPLYREKY